MRHILFYFLLLYCTDLLAQSVHIVANELLAEDSSNTTYDISQLLDRLDKEEKINACIKDYIKKQSNSYSKNVQNDLYDLINNPASTELKIKRAPQKSKGISFEHKLNSLAELQCKAYYSMKILK